MNIYRAVLVSGSPGIGKTTSAHLVAKMAGYNPIELNASDARSKKLIEVSVLVARTPSERRATVACDLPERNRYTTCKGSRLDPELICRMVPISIIPVWTASFRARVSRYVEEIPLYTSNDNMFRAVMLSQPSTG